MQDRWITDWPTSQRFPHYTRANAGEVLADPVSPLGWSFGWDGGIVAGYKAGLIRIGAYEDADFNPQHPESVACFGGYFYINLSAIRMQGVRNPAATVAVFVGALIGCALAHLARLILETEWRPRRCQRGTHCGGGTRRNPERGRFIHRHSAPT